MIDHEKARALIEPFEGWVGHMYLDTEGYVTVGIGNLLPTPQTAIALVWNWRDGGEGEPNEVEIADEWARVSHAVRGLPANQYQRITVMELVPSEVDRLFKRRVGEFETSLQHIFPAFVAWPEPAQLATLDMAFNLGVGALAQRWPKLKAALLRQDWAYAAAESHRPQSRDERNAAIKDLYLQAAAG